MLLLISVIYAISNIGPTFEKCLNDEPKVSPQYHLIKKCHRSKLSISARANFATLSSCKRLALEKRALSFNFSPLGGRTGQFVEYTCEVLQCVEAASGLSLTNDSRYDFYSLYGDPMPTVNTTCVPKTGMFYFIMQNKNYTEAVDVCRNKSSMFADVISEQRTNALAQLLSDVGADYAYVSLKRNNGKDFITANGDSLECTSYRAWAPSHPNKGRNSDCVVITRNSTWQSVPCEVRLPVLCELIPRKPTTNYFTTDQIKGN